MNQLKGEVLAVQTEGAFSLVDVRVGRETLTALLVETPASATYLAPGAAVLVLFKETEVSLARGLSGELSLRNRLPARIAAIRLGQLLAEVALDHRGELLRSVVTARAVLHMRLAVGDEVQALIKANEVMLKAAPDLA